MNLASSMNNLFASKFKNHHPLTTNNLISNDNTLNSSSYSIDRNKKKETRKDIIRKKD